MTSNRRSGAVLHWAGVVICLSVALLLLYSGFAKAMDFGDFVRILGEHRVIPADDAQLVAWLVPMAEAGVGTAGVTLLALDRRRYLPGTASLEGAVFACFAVYAVVGWAGPVPSPSGCGCGIPTLTDHFWTELIARNAVTTCMLGGIAVLASRTRGGRRWAGAERSEAIEAGD